MKRLLKHKRSLWRVVASGLAFALVAGLATSFGLLGTPALAASLHHIEAIKASGSTFVILEVVPEAGTGSIGYYIDGQDPAAGWREDLSAISPVFGASGVVTTPGPDARRAYMTNLFASLTTAGLMGGNAPLTAGSYQEYFPWAAGIPAGASSLRLNVSESVTVQGSFAAQQGGAFSMESVPKLTSNGGYVQRIDSFTYYSAAPTGSGGYYYNPTFVQLDSVQVDDSYAGKAVYTKDGGHYTYQGTLGQNGFALDDSVTYFCVDATREPSASWNEESRYLAVSSGFDEAGSGGYLSMEILGYTYVGQGAGQYALNTGAQGSSTVFYNQVSITGGYTNNHWFLKHVFDYSTVDRSALTLSLISVTPSQLKTLGENGENYVKAADLILLTVGLQPGGSPSHKLSGYTVDNDLTSNIAGLIQAAANDGRPVLADARLNDVTGASQLKTLVNNLTGGRKEPAVAGSVYSFYPNEARSALATGAFSRPFDYTSPDPYSAVRSEIQYENFLRAQAGEEPLSSDVSMATCLRYIINYSGHRAENKKTVIKVLDVEPLTQLSGSSSTRLSQDTVLSWLPSGIQRSNIQITTMSTAEFIGKIEDINEEYDLVYIGASLDNFNKKNNLPDYNDGDMDGLFYSNMGDSYKGNTSLGASNNLTYRFSGNDITDAKKRELVNFANSGLPIIVADSLIKEGRSGYEGGTLSVTLSAQPAGDKVALTATPSLSRPLPSGISVSYAYQWEQFTQGAWKAVSSATTSSYSANSVNSSYRCAVTLLLGSGSNVKAYTESAKVIDGNYYAAPSSVTTTSISVPFGQVTRQGGTYTVTIPNGATASNYQWYGWTTSGTDRYISIPNQTSNTLTNSSYNYYMCIVTVNGTIYYSQEISSSKAMGQFMDREPVDVGGSTNQRSTTNVSLSIMDVTVTPGSSSASLLASTNYSWPLPVSSDYGWRRTSGSSHPPSGWSMSGTASTYFFRISVGGSNYASSQNYAIQRGFDVAITGSSTPASISSIDAISETIDPDRVDCNSRLYAALSGLLTSKVNVMPAAEAVAQKDTVLKYLNLSKPAIALSQSPAPYTSESNLSASLIPGGTLSFNFTISNPTDPTPASTRYTVRLYVDQNSDGRYSSMEELTDLTIYRAQARVAADNLQISMAGGTEYSYSISRTLPPTLTGMIPWKLEVVDNRNNAVHASQIGYTYVKPAQRTTIKVLQVAHNDGAFKLASSGKYKGFFENLAAQNLYDIEITTITIAQINDGGLSAIKNACANAYLPSTGRSNTTSVASTVLEGIAGGTNNKIDTRAKISQFFDKFDMLVLGFNDTYGSLNERTAQAVTDYIASGKAVLFTHDTTSFYDGNWGQEFNKIIRDAVGLDRYGVSPGAVSTIAHDTPYKPKSSPTAPVGAVTEKYAYTTMTMRRYRSGDSQLLPSGLANSGVGGITTTTSVSQVNTGQVTTFPYYLNTSKNASNQPGITVALTHEQYFQLNMSDDDIVVWYCLAGGDYEQTKNDVVNNYYIYNQGNVTYSGAGHSNPDSSDNEAKLFINTMVAAFRAAAVPPKIELTTSSGTKADSQFFSVEYNSNEGSYAGTILTTSEKSPDRAIYFKPQDYNLSAAKSVSVQFYYESPTGAVYYDLATRSLRSAFVQGATVRITPLSVSLYRADTGEAVRSGTSLSSDTVYVFYLPDSVLNEFGLRDVASIKLVAEVTTRISEATYKGYDSIELRKLGLLSLS